MAAAREVPQRADHEHGALPGPRVRVLHVARQHSRFRHHGDGLWQLVLCDRVGGVVLPRDVAYGPRVRRGVPAVEDLWDGDFAGVGRVCVGGV